MGKMLKFTFEGEPVAAKRPRVTRNGTFNDPVYANYKDALSAYINVHFRDWASSVPELLNKRRKYMKDNRYALLLSVYRTKNRGDIDNYIKSILDSIQDAGVIGDDSQVDTVIAGKFIDKDNPRVEIELVRI